MQFERADDPHHISAAFAVERGNTWINYPVRAMLVTGFGGAYLIAKYGDPYFSSETISWIAGILSIFGFSFAWLWWSYHVPRWRVWALRHGADANELQRLGVEIQLLWPRGSIFEKTEFKVDP